MKLFNSMSRKKEEFVPITPGEVKMYCCGPTVYNYIHVGNARPMILFDVLRRYLEYRGYKVTFVQNFTDVDDKIIKRANEEHATSQEISEKYIEEYFKDAHGLGVRDATVHPKATENIQQIIDLVQTLIDKGYAYPVNGDVYYRTKKFEGYGKLSHQPIEDLQAGARIDVNDVKEDPLDFALWKAAKPGEPYWDSPWGQGRPGWHIECSAMSNRSLGKTIDIHCRQRMYLRPLLAAQRLPEHQQPEDVQVPGQLLHRPRGRRSLRVRGRPLLHALRPVPLSPELIPRLPHHGAERPGAPLHRREQPGVPDQERCRRRHDRRGEGLHRDL